MTIKPPLLLTTVGICNTTKKMDAVAKNVIRRRQSYPRYRCCGLGRKRWSSPPFFNLHFIVHARFALKKLVVLMFLVLLVNLVDIKVSVIVKKQCDKEMGVVRVASAIRIDWKQFDYSYRILDDDDNNYYDGNTSGVILFEGGDVAVYMVDKWCVLGQNLISVVEEEEEDNTGRSVSLRSPRFSSSSTYDHRLWNTTIVSIQEGDNRGKIIGIDPILGPYDTPVEVQWICHVETQRNLTMNIPILAKVHTYYRSRVDDDDDQQDLQTHRNDMDKAGYALEFKLEFPNGTPKRKGESNRHHGYHPSTTVGASSFTSPRCLSAENDTDICIDVDTDMSMTNFPALHLFSRSDASSATNGSKRNKHHFSYLSWHGSFVQSVRGLSKGPTGGPTVFFKRRRQQRPRQQHDDDDDDDLQVLIGSPWKFHFKAFTAGNNKHWRATDHEHRTGEISNPLDNSTGGCHGDCGMDASWWSPGTSVRIANGREGLPKGYRQSIILYEGRRRSGITSALYEWGRLMQEQHSQSLSGRRQKKNAEHNDITLTHIGYQTDNGAAYCFCKESNCSRTLIDEIHDLRNGSGRDPTTNAINKSIPIGYLSFQGAGSSSGRGQAAPWCVETWGVDDGGLDPNHYPIPIKDMQKAIDIPLQLYCPYFCPTTRYFNTSSDKNHETAFSPLSSTDRHDWSAIASDPSLHGCGGFDFRTITPEQSYDFYGWFMDKGVKVGMKSFETDFMNQNYNCVPDLIESATKGDMMLSGMAAAALERNLSVQLCYATPTDVLSSLGMPAVTQFRVSFDFCYGRSWDIGESSMLVWALGRSPSKDTLWTSDNGKFETPGCDWTADHENPAAELHLVLALMSTGPVGISDLRGWTNRTLLKRAIRSDGMLLKPMKALTAVDRTFISGFPAGYYLYSTFGIGPSWIFLEFESDESTININDNSEVVVSSTLSRRDFWPPIRKRTNQTMVYRHSGTYQTGRNDCLNGSDALMSCISGIFRFDNDLNKNNAARLPLASQLNSRRHVSSLLSAKGGAPVEPFVPMLTYVWEACDKSGWVLLGELDKYVPLSGNRFKDFACTSNGLHVLVMGAPNETVILTALQPQTTNFASDRYSVVSIEVLISSDGNPIEIELGGDHLPSTSW